MKKKFVVWNPKWDTGIEVIDAQHKYFVGMINRAYVINESDEGVKEMRKILNEMMDHSRVHFSTEEKFLSDTGYPETDDHKHKHSILLKEALDFYERFEEEEEEEGFHDVVNDFLVFLKGWLDDHLIKVDHRYVHWLKSHGIK